MGVNILFKERQIQWNDNKIPLKTVGSVHNKDTCSMIYSKYTNSPLLQEAEERQDKMMDCSYSKVDIDALVAELDIKDSSREQLRATLRKFEKGQY